jgi:transcriptional regulator with XRE-family HTH domain
MSENENLKKIILWLISQGIIRSQEDLAQILGYNASSVSQIVTGKKPLSKKFAKKIAGLSEKININYLFGGEKMLNDEIVGNTQEITIVPRDRLEISDLIKAINNISEAALKNADSDRIRAEAELKRAEAEDRNSRNMEELIKLLKSDKKEEDKVTAKKERLAEKF